MEDFSANHKFFECVIFSGVEVERMIVLREKAVSGMTLTLLLIGMLTLAFDIQSVKAEPSTIVVPDDYPTIQEAINNANEGDAIFVRNGTYCENVVVNKTVSLVGENKEATVIDGNMTGNCVTVEADNVTVSDFKIQNSTLDWGYLIAIFNCQGIWVLNNTLRTAYYKILLENCSNCVVQDNYVPGGFKAIILTSSNRNRISNNFILGCTQYTLPIGSFYAIYLYKSDMNCIEHNIIADCDIGIYLLESRNNTIRSNIICDDYIPHYHPSFGIWLESSNHSLITENSISTMWQSALALYHCNGTVIYHNNFIDNVEQVYLEESYNNTWDDEYPSGGNYWSDYTGVDLYSGPYQNETSSDGIGDTAYIIDSYNMDHYPLTNPYGASPPQTCNLTIITTVGGTTNPALGTYSYTVNSSIQVTAIPNANYLFDYWELDTINVGSANPYTISMDKDYTLKAVFSPIPPPLSASISPLLTSILVGQSVTFTSAVSGGCSPYSYAWYLNGNPESGANESSWAFTPTTSEVYYIHLEVTDAKGNTAQSETARITAATVSVGGYSIPIQGQAKAKPTISYKALIAILTTLSVGVKRKTNRKR
jgi:parallel beta-helix repeat protein